MFNIRKVYDMMIKKWKHEVRNFPYHHKYDSAMNNYTEKRGKPNMNIEEKLADVLGEDGKLDMTDVFSVMLKSKNGRVDREAFLREVLEGRCSQELIDKAVESSPAAAGLTVDELKELADAARETSRESLKENPNLKESAENIKESENAIKETAETIGSLMENKNLREAFRLAQKNMYLFGAPQVEFTEKGVVKGNKSRLFMMLCLSVMMEVDGASDALKALIAALPKLKDEEISLENLSSEEFDTVFKKFRKKTLAFKTVSTAAGSNPLVGKLFSAGMVKSKLDTFSNRLRDALSDTVATNPKHQVSEKEQQFAELFSKISE